MIHETRPLSAAMQYIFEFSNNGTGSMHHHHVCIPVRQQHNI